jgi:SAM-dependent methyltransferase
LTSPIVAWRASVTLPDGRLHTLESDRWLGPADDVDLRVLARARGPVLDIGCGPGRHVEALSEQAVEVLGMDLTPDFVAAAQRQGRPVVLQSVFDPIPGGNRWQSALMLDGSVGIGGDPVTLLRRVDELLAPGGRAIVETAAPDERSGRGQMVIESEVGADFSFDWATLSVADAWHVARAACFSVTDVWEDTGRWFAQLDK